MSKFTKLSRAEMKNVQGGKLDPNCFTNVQCTIPGVLGVGNCDGNLISAPYCGCMIMGREYGTPDCYRL